MPPVSVKQYYKAFYSIFGGFATAFSVLPLVSQALPDHWWLSSYLFPPLNDAYRLPALLITGLVTVVVYRWHDSPFVLSRTKRRRASWSAFALVVVGLSAFLLTTELFVKTIERPSVGDNIKITVGYQRTDYARQNFGGDIDEVMLRKRGPTDEEVYRLWTTSSVLVARWTLLISYLLFLGSAIGVLSLEVLYSVIPEATDA